MNTKLLEPDRKSAQAVDHQIEARRNAALVLRVSIGELLTSKGAALLSPVITGCLVAMVRFVCATKGASSPTWSRVEAKDVRALLSMKGLTCEDAAMAIAALELAGLLEIDAHDRIEIPILTKVMRLEIGLVEARLAGHPLESAAQKVTGAAPVPVSLATAESEAHENQPITPRLKKSKAAAGATTRRFSATDSAPTDPELDPVAIRVPLLGDKTGELTQEYVSHLQAGYPTIDAMAQLKLAALWCESNKSKRKTFTGLRRFLNSWLARAATEVDVRSAVVRAGSQRNGFGQGGAAPVLQAQQHQSLEAGAASDPSGIDDLLDCAEVDQHLAAHPAAAVLDDWRGPDRRGEFDADLGQDQQPTDRGTQRLIAPTRPHFRPAGHRLL